MHWWLRGGLRGWNGGGAHGGKELGGKNWGLSEEVVGRHPMRLRLEPPTHREPDKLGVLQNNILLSLHANPARLPQPKHSNNRNNHHVRKHGPKTRTIPLQYHHRILVLKGRALPTMTRRSTRTHNAKCDDLTHANPQRHPKLPGSVEHRTSEALRLLREAVADNDKANGEENICTERGEDLRPEDKVPVLPGGIHERHDEGRNGADERGADDEPARGKAVHHEADGEVDDDAGDEAGEEVEGGGHRGSILDFLEAERCGE